MINTAHDAKNITIFFREWHRFRKTKALPMSGTRKISSSNKLQETMMVARVGNARTSLNDGKALNQCTGSIYSNETVLTKWGSKHEQVAYLPKVACSVSVRKHCWRPPHDQDTPGFKSFAVCFMFAIACAALSLSSWVQLAKPQLLRLEHVKRHATLR